MPLARRWSFTLEEEYGDRNIFPEVEALCSQPV
jgi:hypothetical protein